MEECLPGVKNPVVFKMCPFFKLLDPFLKPQCSPPSAADRISQSWLLFLTVGVPRFPHLKMGTILGGLLCELSESLWGTLSVAPQRER